MRAAFASRASRLRSTSLSTVPPPRQSAEYSSEYATTAASILYRSPLPAQSGLPVYILNAAAFPDAFEVDYDALLPYVLARLPGEEELLAGEDYEVIFFAGGQPDSATSEKKSGPGMGWYLQAYHVLSRAVRKRLQKLYIVHERSWVRVLVEVFGTFVSPKFRRKIVHITSLSGLAVHIPIQNLLIPPSVYLHDRRIAPDIYAPYVSGRRAFAADEPLPRSLKGERRLPRVLRESTTFVCMGANIKQEGIFRIPAHSTTLGVLREAYDRSQRFIIWREGSVRYTEPNMDAKILREVHLADTYGLASATSIIKLWYRELKTPIFEETCYTELRDRFGQRDQDMTNELLAELFSPTASTSLLSQTSRYILTMHLLPLLSRVSHHEDENKMSADNLAICFAPALVCGPDQMADAKISSVIRKILAMAIDAWEKGLREACEVSQNAFVEAIQPPKNRQDYEDPLYQERIQEQEDEKTNQPQHKILLIDTDVVSEGPPLPPRPSTQVSYPTRTDSLATSPLKRKPAPPLAPPPRYSAVVIVPDEVSNSRVNHAEATRTLEPSHMSASILPSYEQQEKHFATDTNARLQGSVKNEPEAGGKAMWPTTTEEDKENAELASQHTLSAPSDFMKELKKSLATSAVTRKPVSSSPTSTSPSSPAAATPAKSTPQRSVSGDAPSSTKDGVFARPTWAASARQVSAPVVPQQPLLSTTPTTLTPTYISRPRTPSPGLLKRMTSIESMKSSQVNAGIERLPKAAGLEKASVDDLRRLYEERAGTVAKLANASRRSSNVSATSNA